MKSKIKAFAAAAFAVMTIAAVSLSSLAGQWVQHGPGWKYQNDDGSFLNDGWHWIDGNGDGIAEDYYFKADGYIITNGKTPDGKTVDDTGAWTVNGRARTRAALVSEEEIANWLDGSVFVGDSLMEGFGLYAATHANDGREFLSKLKFFAVVSYSLYNDVHGAVRPMYMGRKMTMAEALPQIGAKRVFMMFGANDLDTTGVDGTLDEYKNAVARLRAAQPDIDVNIISMTYVTDTYHQKGSTLSSEVIKNYNNALAALCAEQGWGFVDLADSLNDGSGNLPHGYAAKDGVHQNNAAYAIWANVVHDYAKARAEAER